MTKNLIALFLLLTLVACSQKSTHVGLKVSHNFVYGGAAMSAISGGGLMVWGQSKSGQSFGQAIENKDEINLNLAPGEWTFYAMSWDGSKNYEGMSDSTKSTPFGGVTYCAKSIPTSLSGTTANVELSLTTSNCSDAAFVGNIAGSGSTLPGLRLQFCSSITNIKSMADECMDDSSNPMFKSFKAPIISYKIKTENFINKDVKGNGLSTPCVSHGSFPNIPNLPAGGIGLPFQIKIEMYIGDDQCDATSQRGLITTVFPNGIANKNASKTSKYFSGLDYHQQYIEVTPQTICKGRTGTSSTDHSFAGGMGTYDRPYIICSVPQWLSINKKSDYMDASFKLQNNLDFNPYSKGLTLDSSLPSQHTCLELGNNFLPIGYTNAVCTSGTMVWGTPESFKGSIYGSGYTLKNLRFRDEDRTHVGLIAFASGSSYPVWIGDLRFENIEVSGASKVGIIAGMADGAGSVSNFSIRNIKIYNSTVEARDEQVVAAQVGMVVGHLIYGSIDTLWIENGHVRSDNREAGGVAGLALNSEFRRVSAEVDLIANSRASSMDSFGGLVGRIESSVMDYVKHEGGIFIHGSKAGGIAGEANGTHITNFYSITKLHSSSMSPTNMGGVVGHWNGTSNFGPGYTLAHISSDCTTSCSQGTIFGYTMEPPTPQGKVYILSELQSGAFEGYSQADIRSLEEFKISANVNELTNIDSNDWLLQVGKYPRFDFEKHPCSLPVIAGSTLGTSAKPHLICDDANYYSLSGAPTNTYYKLMANLRLDNAGSSQFEIPNFRVHLLGNNKSLIGGHTIYTASTDSTSHIGTLTGSIRNLKILGMKRMKTTTGAQTQNASTFVNINQGTLENIQAWIYPNFLDHSAGLVGRNTGTMSRIFLDGKYRGTYSFASLAYHNSGTIKDSKISGELKCNDSASCEFMAGVVVQNSGMITRVEAGARLMDQAPSISSNVSMIVDENTPTASILDVLVPKHATYTTRGSVHFYFHRANFGQVQRVVNYGNLLTEFINPSDELSSFPTSLSAFSADNGTHVDVYFGGNSGKMILNGPYTCFAANTLEVSGWAALSWDNHLLTVLDYNLLTNPNKKLVVEFETLSGNKFKHQVTEYATNRFTIPADNCTENGTVSIYWTDHLPVNPGLATAASQIILPQNETASAYGTSWRSQIWDFSVPSERDAMLAYKAYLFGIPGSSAVTPRSWKYEPDEGLSLFDLD